MKIVYDAKQNKSVVIIVLAGYKQFLWSKVLTRLKQYAPNWADVCLLSSGKEVKELEDIAKNYSWSYCCTDINNVCLAENECIEFFDEATYIFKMDEDIFVTKDTFKRLLSHYIKAYNCSEYMPGFIAPMINVNCVCYYELLKRTNNLSEFQTLFGNAKITNGLHHNQHILEDSAVAMFIWSKISIDDTSFLSKTMDLYPCPVRFSIGLIMFRRTTWEDFGNFTVELDSIIDYKRIGLGTDEKDICKYAMMKAKPLLIDRSVLVGHLSYGPQTADMKRFFEEHPERF